jgi:hypothetical protein
VHRAQHGVIEPSRCGATAADSNYVVMEEPDRIQPHDAQASAAIVQYAGNGPKIVMDGRGRPVLTEASDPDGALRIGKIGVDIRASKSNLQRARLRLRFGGLDLQVEQYALTISTASAAWLSAFPVGPR